MSAIDSRREATESYTTQSRDDGTCKSTHGSYSEGKGKSAEISESSCEQLGA